MQFSAYAEEGGSGAYTPGSNATIIDGMLTKPGFITRLNLFYYNAANHIRCVPPSCSDVADVYGWAKAASLTLGWRPNLDLGSKWSYMTSLSIPYVQTSIKADIPSSEAAAFSLRDTDQGIGDILFYPAIVHYHVNQDLALGMRLGIYAPTGAYNSTDLANFGKNYWSFMPEVSAIYFGTQNLIEASLFLAANFNTENHETSYKTGAQVHAEYNVKKYYPFYKGLGGLGVTGYWYEQITGDSGAGAVYGDYKAQVYGVGPTFAYLGELGGQNVAVEFKWVRDINARNRFHGDTVLLKYGIIF